MVLRRANDSNENMLSKPVITPYFPTENTQLYGCDHKCQGSKARREGRGRIPDLSLVEEYKFDEGLIFMAEIKSPVDCMNGNRPDLVKLLNLLKDDQIALSKKD